MDRKSRVRYDPSGEFEYKDYSQTVALDTVEYRWHVYTSIAHLYRYRTTKRWDESGKSTYTSEQRVDNKAVCGVSWSWRNWPPKPTRKCVKCENLLTMRNLSV